MPPRLPIYWEELRSGEFATLDPERTLAVLPVAAIEQHGPHLPVGVDAYLNTAVLDRALLALPRETPVLVLPAQVVGKSDEHLAFRGTLTLTATTLMRAWSEIGHSVRRAGVRKLLLFNSHGGQIQPMQMVARQLRGEAKMLAVAASWYGWGLPPGLVSDAEMAHGIHAGLVETAMMLAVRPDLVRMDLAASFASATLQDETAFPRLRALGAAGIGWQSEDLNTDGAVGDAAAASPGLGEAVLAHAAGCLAELMLELVRYPLDRLKDAPT